MSEGHENRGSTQSRFAPTSPAAGIGDEGQVSMPSVTYTSAGNVPPVDTAFQQAGPSASDLAFGPPPGSKLDERRGTLERSEFAYEMAQTAATSLTSTYLPSYRAARDRVEPQTVAKLGGQILGLLAQLHGAKQALDQLQRQTPHQDVPGASPDEDLRLARKHEALETKATTLLPLIKAVDANVGATLPPHEFHGVEVGGKAVVLDLSAMHDDEAFDKLAGELQRTIEMLAFVEDMRKRLLHDKNGLSRENLDAARLQLAQWASRPLDLAFLHVALGPLWDVLEKTATSPMDRKPSDMLSDATKQAQQTGWLGDRGRFDIDVAVTHLQVGGRQMAELVLADLFTADPDTRARLLVQMKERGIFDKFCHSLGWEPLKQLHDSLGAGFGPIKHDLQQYFLGPRKFGPELGREWENHDWSASALAERHLGVVGKAMNKVADFGSFGFYSSYGKAIDDQSHGLVGDDEAARERHDVYARTAAVAFVSMLTGGAADKLVRGGRAGMSIAGGIAGGSVGSMTGEFTSDVYNVYGSGEQEHFSSPVEYVKAGIIGGVFGGILGRFAKARPKGGAASETETVSTGERADVSPSTNPYREHQNPRISSAAKASGLDLGALSEQQFNVLETVDQALAEGDIRRATQLLDQLRSSQIAPDILDAFEARLAEAHGRTPPSVYRDPKAVLPDGTKIPPSAQGGKLYYGSDAISPDQAFEKGLPGRGPNTNLLDHVEQKPDSAYRGTTRHILSPGQDSGAALWAGDGGWVYEIDGTPSWDVNKELQGRVRRPDGTFGDNPMRGEQEHATLANIPPGRIVRAIQIVAHGDGYRLGQSLPNPNYEALKP